MVPGWIIYCSFILCLVRVSTGVVAQETNDSIQLKPTLRRLSDHLMDGYKKGTRPVYDWRQTTLVTIDIIIFAILGVDEKNQVLRTYLICSKYWNDEFLSWDPKKFDNVTQISMPAQYVWIPDIVVLEFIDTARSPDTPYVYVTYKGKVRDYKPLLIVTACSLNIYYFPFDTQWCTISFTSWLHTIKEVNVTTGNKKPELKHFKSNYMEEGEWKLIDVFTNYKLLRDHEFTFGEIEFTLVIRRRPFFYAVSLLLPSVFLILLDMAGFYIPPESSERISFKITLLLGYSVFLIIVSDTLPATGTPLIGVYYIMCMAFLTISLIQSIFIVKIVHQHNVRVVVPKWLKYLVLKKLMSLLGIHNKMFEVLFNRPSRNTQKIDNIGETHKSRTDSPQENQMSMDLTLSASENCQLLSKILKEIVSIREHVKNNDDEMGKKEWLQVAYVLDTFLFRTYLFAVFMFVAALASIWSVRYKA